MIGTQSFNAWVRVSLSQMKFPETQEIVDKLINMLPNRVWYTAANILIMKHEQDYYLLKIRPGYDTVLEISDFLVVPKCSMPQDPIIVKSLRQKSGGFILFDITGYKLPL